MNPIIESNLAVMMYAGRQGTGATVELRLERLAVGETFYQILAAHPRLTRPATVATIPFGAAALRAAV